MDELFCSDRQLSTSAFPEELIPFPDPEPQPPLSSTADLLYPQSTPLNSPPVPQKLRPIRSNGRNPLDYPNPDEPFQSPELGFAPFQSDMTGDEMLKMKSEMDAHFISNFKSQLSNYSFSSCSDGSADSAAHNPEEPTSDAKPRKKRKKNMESFLQGLMSQVIHKQEQMHQQLMDLIETNERERILREDAWRRQEIDRANRDHHIRAQEAARSVALISFIRNALGVPDIQVPELLPLPPAFSGEHPAADHKPLPQPELDNFDPGSKRWPSSEVQALITLRAALDHKFHTLGTKAPVWEEVSVGMANMGYTRSARKCKEKWENLNKYYKKATGNGKKHSENAKACPYFHELENLYNNRLITAAKPNSPCNEQSQQDGKL